jgi:hypothetical protein
VSPHGGIASTSASASAIGGHHATERSTKKIHSVLVLIQTIKFWCWSSHGFH